MADDDDQPETERQRMMINIGIAVFLAALVGAGIWLANTIVDVRKTQDCLLSGRRNCAPIATPGRDSPVGRPSASPHKRRRLISSFASDSSVNA